MSRELEDRIAAAAGRPISTELGGFDEDDLLVFREGLEFILRLALKADARAIASALVEIREHGERSTRKLGVARGLVTTAYAYEKALRTLEDGEFAGSGASAANALSGSGCGPLPPRRIGARRAALSSLRRSAQGLMCATAW